MSYLEKKGVNCTNKLYSTRLSSMVVLPFKGKSLKKIQIVVDFSMMPDRVTITGWDFIFYFSEDQNAILAYSTSFTCSRNNYSVKADEKPCGRYEPAPGRTNATVAQYDK